MLAGVAYGVWKTRGFQTDLVNFDGRARKR
jgi:hypothetical protein